MAEKELCGHPTEKGPCNMPKGHRVHWHRHRSYSEVTWTIETPEGVRIDSGSARVPLNYAVTEALDKHPLIVIHLKKWDTDNKTNATTTSP